MRDFRRVLSSPVFRCAIVLAVLGLLLGTSARAESPPLTVTTTDVSGDGVCDSVCTLPEAAAASEGNPGKDTIAFDIPGPAPHTISVGRLDFFDPEGVVIDGTTQPGWAPGAPVVVIDDSDAIPDAQFAIFGGNSTVRGLVIHGGAVGISLGNGANVVEGNFIGTDFFGVTAVPTGAGVLAGPGGNNRIGGTTPTARNVIVVSGDTAVQLTGSGNIVQGNFLGTNAAGTEALGGGGVRISGGAATLGGTTGTTLGGPCTGACNLIVGGGVFVGVPDSSNSVVQGNFIGTDVNGTAKLGFVALELDGDDNVLGGTEPGRGNVIAGGANPSGSSGPFVVGNDNHIEGNRIGTDVTGSKDFGNDGLTIIGDRNHIGGTAGTTPGGPCTGACNLISGNGSGVGILFGSSGNVVEGNFIGTDVTGTVDLGNNGLGVGGGADTVIGGAALGAGNVISGNGGDGINVASSATIEGNLIGTDATGDSDLGNDGRGVAAATIQAGSSIVIGGDTASAHNVISGNGNDGIEACGAVRVIGNHIGTDITGNLDVGNTAHGVGADCSGETIGEPGAGNVISGNGLDGVAVGISEDVTIQGNRIGTNAAGTEPLGNGRDGVSFFGAQNLVVGGTAPGEGNLISANGGNGVEQFAGPSASPLVVQGNRIGTDVTGMLDLGNGGDGVHAGGAVTIGGTTNTTPGGPCTGACNLISGNDRDGVFNSPFGESVQGNFVGTNITGQNAVPNTGNGLVIGCGTRVGDGTPPGRNVISGNGRDGLVIECGANEVLGNFVGTSADGEHPLGNRGDGVRINQLGNTIGSPGAGNVISANGAAGIEDRGGFSTIQGNRIGTDPNGAQDLGNLGDGVVIDTAGATGMSTIGGPGQATGNTIAFNGGHGVSIRESPGNTVQRNSIFSNALDGLAVVSAQSFSNAILTNSIHGNGDLGIDLDDDGVTPNDAGDFDAGANLDQNFPVLTTVVGGGKTIEGTLNTIPGTYRIELFANRGVAPCDPSGNGEGENFLDFVNVTTDGNGDANFTKTLAAPVPADEVITATATSLDNTPNNTSEFSQCETVPPPPSAIVVRKRTEPAGDPATFSFAGDASGAIGDGETVTVGDLAPGTYISTETVPPGWDLASISCDDGDSTGDVGTATATFRVAAGETVTCTFTDFKRGTIVVRKKTDPPGAPGSFAFTGDAAGSIGDGGTITVPSLSTVGAPTYHSTESDPTPTFDLSSISCDDGTSAHPSGGDRTSRTATFRLDPGETVVCTFGNTERGTVSARKTVSGSPITSLLPPEQQSFTFQLRQGASTTSAGTLLEQAEANVANGGVVNFASKLVAGSPYQVCEIVMPGWRTTLGPSPFVLYNPSGDNSTLCANFSVAPGEAKSIAVDNQPPPGGLARTIGFWKNWASCASSSGNQRPVLDQTLAAADPDGIAIGTLTLHAGDCLKAVRLLNKSTINTGKKMASDPAFNLAAQLLAAKLNVKAGAVTCPNAISAIDDAQALLAAVHFNGITHDRLSAAQAAQANALATTLDRYNNNLLC